MRQEGVTKATEHCPELSMRQEGVSRGAEICPELSARQEGVTKSTEICPELSVRREGVAKGIENCPELSVRQEGVRKDTEICPELSARRDGASRNVLGHPNCVWSKLWRTPETGSITEMTWKECQLGHGLDLATAMSCPELCDQPKDPLGSQMLKPT